MAKPTAPSVANFIAGSTGSVISWAKGRKSAGRDVCASGSSIRQFWCLNQAKKHFTRNRSELASGIPNTKRGDRLRTATGSCCRKRGAMERIASFGTSPQPHGAAVGSLAHWLRPPATPSHKSERYGAPLSRWSSHLRTHPLSNLYSVRGRPVNDLCPTR